MRDTTIEDLATHYVFYCYETRKTPGSMLTHWAGSLLGELAFAEPELAWRLILAVLAKDSSMVVLPLLAAGPMEELLSEHENAYLERAEDQARHDPAFAKLLGGVWQHGISDAGWVRLQNAMDRRGWDGNPD